MKYLPPSLLIPQVICVDLETTGTDSLRNEIISLSISASNRSGEIDSLELKMRPENDFWDKDAESVHGISRFEAERFMPQSEGASKLVAFLERFSQSVLVCHSAFMYNSYFDVNFLNQFLNKFYGHNALYSRTLIQTSTITWLRWLERCGVEKNDAYDLAYLCKKYRIELNHHDATSDRKACQKLFYMALDLAKNVNFEPHAMERMIR